MQLIAILRTRAGQRAVAFVTWLLIFMVAMPALAASRRAAKHVSPSHPKPSHAGNEHVTGGHPRAHTARHTRRSAHSAHSGHATKRSRHHSARAVLPSGPQMDRVQQIQSALAQQGVYQGSPSGKWDDSTSDAMRRFQDRNGLSPTGKLDAPSLQRLGLGSDVAGLNPPRPAMPPASRDASLSGNDLPKPPGD